MNHTKKFSVPLKTAKRSVIAMLIGIIFPWLMINRVQAHDFENHSSSDPTQWIIGSLMFIAAVVTIGIWSKLIYSASRRKVYPEMMRSITVLSSFILWFALIAVQQWVVSREADLFMYSLAFGLGYFVLPFALFALWRVVLFHAGSYIRSILKIRRYWILLIGTTILYGLFYLFASGLVAPPDPEDPPLPDQGFFGTSEFYGPLTFWPNIEFWWPGVNLFGAVSVGTLFMLITLAGFMAISVVLLVYNWRSRKNKSFHIKEIGGTTGSSMVIASTSFCCCCLPVLYPLLGLLVGSTAAESLSLFLVKSSGPLFNLVQFAILSMMTVTAISASKRLSPVMDLISNNSDKEVSIR
jgi:hypothetical protein